MIRAAPLAFAALIAGAAMTGPAMAGDASGFDPASIDQCLDAARTQGTRADCATTGMDACLTYARARYSGDDPDFPMANCLDASHQAWEARLSASYDAAMASEGKKGIKPQEMLRQTERSWLQFRDDLCHQAGDAAPEGQAALAAARCIRDETARQNALLMALEPAE